MYAWGLTLKRVASAPVAEPLRTLLEECLDKDPSKRPRNFAAISGRLEIPAYVAWGQQLADLQLSEARTAMTRSHEAALQAATFLAEEREKWMGAGECSREEASDAYLFFSRACIRARKPHEQLQALRKSIQLLPQRATDPMLLLLVGNNYGAVGNYKKNRDVLEKALRHYASERVVAKVLHSLGTAYGNLGDHEKKRDYLERALRIFEAHYGPEHVE
eukprot:4450595-Amphidinium_carterae.1